MKTYKVWIDEDTPMNIIADCEDDAKHSFLTWRWSEKNKL